MLSDTLPGGTQGVSRVEGHDLLDNLKEYCNRISDRKVTRRVGKNENDSFCNIEEEEDDDDPTAALANSKRSTTRRSVAFHGSTPVSGAADVSASSKGLHYIKKRMTKKVH